MMEQKTRRLNHARPAITSLVESALIRRCLQNILADQAGVVSAAFARMMRLGEGLGKASAEVHTFQGARRWVVRILFASSSPMNASATGSNLSLRPSFQLMAAA